MGVVIMTGSFSMKAIVLAQQRQWFVIPQFLGFIIFFIAGIAEAHRLPSISRKRKASWWRVTIPNIPG